MLNGFLSGFSGAGLFLFCSLHLSISSRPGRIARVDRDHFRLGSIRTVVDDVLAGKNAIRGFDGHAGTFQGIRSVFVFRLDIDDVERIDRVFEFDGCVECGIRSERMQELLQEKSDCHLRNDYVGFVHSNVFWNLERWSSTGWSHQP